MVAEQVISNDGPWSVTVEWRGIEFDVPFLVRDNLVLPAEEAAGDRLAAGPLG